MRIKSPVTRVVGMVTFIHLLNTYMLSTEWAPSSVLGTGVTCCKQQEKEFLILRADGLQGGGDGEGGTGCRSENKQMLQPKCTSL